MSKTITIPVQAQLQEYHKELQQRERQERKDKCILLSLAVAGLVGVYALVLNSVNQSNLTESAPIELEQGGNRAADVNSLR